MPFMVIFKNDGKPGYHPVDDLDAALRFVEHLRNSEGVLDASVFRLEEVPIEVKAYYKVEVARAPSPESEPVEPVEAVDESEDLAAAGARRGLFAR